ncbi:aliphatic sulfonates ABC transporter ATP-binding protein [soil metagenome]
MSGSPLRLVRLAKRFGAATVLDGLNLEIAPGSFLAVVGRSGTGKSTLLRLILGLEESSGGEVIGPPPAEARLMFQEPRLLPWATVLGNVEVGLGQAHDPERARAALRAVGLEDREGDWPETLSGGQRQRVALARALVSSPRLLALDEPLGALDALTRIEMQALLEQVWRDQGFTAVLVTHDVSEAVSLADRVIVLQDGVISLDLAVDLPRPRQRGSAKFARLEQRLLDELLAKAA